MQLKSRHIYLYLVACLVLAASKVSGLSLLAIAVLLQILILLQNKPLTKKAQWAQLKLFFLTVPSFFFWGGAHSFVFIYLREGSILFAFMAAGISLSLSLLIAYQLIFCQQFLEKNDYSVTIALGEAFNEIRNKKGQLFSSTGLIFLFSFVPYLTTDWKLVFALTATLFYQHRLQLKTAFSRL
jgi:hypothetical protein